MSPKRSKCHPAIPTTSAFPCEVSETETCWRNDIFTSRPPADFASSPDLAQRPIIKAEPGETNLTRTSPTRRASAEDVQSFIPKWLQNRGGGGGGQDPIPGHFILVATSPASPLVKWEGPNVMGVSTGITDIFEYIREQLGVFWMEWVELHTTGFSPSHFPPRPVWGQVDAFHEDICSHTVGCDGLGTLRDGILHRNMVYNTPYVQVIIRVRPPRLRWLAQSTVPTQQLAV